MFIGHSIVLPFLLYINDWNRFHRFFSSCHQPDSVQQQNKQEPNRITILSIDIRWSLHSLYIRMFRVCKYLTTHFSVKTSRLIIVHIQLKYDIYTCACVGKLFFIRSTSNIADVIKWVPLRNPYWREKLNSLTFFIDFVVYTNNTFKYDYIKF